MLTLEHRSAPAPEPFPIELVTDDDAYLRVSDDEDASARLPEPPLADAVRRLLAGATEPLPRVALRASLRVNNQRLGDALRHLEREHVAEKTPHGWRLRTLPQAPLRS